jgi:hypothetical protein
MATAALCAAVLLMPIAEAAPSGVPEVKAHSAVVSVTAFQAHVKNLQELVQACGANAANCDAAKVGDDDRVDAQHFQMRWGWLREALQGAHDDKPAEREALVRSASERLDEIAKETTAADAGSAAEFAKARADANRILDRAEFQDVQQASWWDRQLAKFWYWVGRGLNGTDSLGAKMPWLGTVLEFMLFGAAGVGLLIYVQRNLQRQRLAVALNSQTAELAWKRESTDWAAEADGWARDGAWRDAVHCLYWATIVMLEGRRAWRHNPARTPREYVRLLKPGSAQQGALRGLTQIFERLWYGLRDARPEDYEKARSLYENLRDNNSASAASNAASGSAA